MVRLRTPVTHPIWIQTHTPDTRPKVAHFSLLHKLDFPWEGMCLVTQCRPHAVSLLWRLPLDLGWPARWPRGSGSGSPGRDAFVLRLACRSVAHANWQASATHLRRPGRERPTAPARTGLGAKARVAQNLGEICHGKCGSLVRNLIQVYHDKTKSAENSNKILGQANLMCGFPNLSIRDTVLADVIGTIRHDPDPGLPEGTAYRSRLHSDDRKVGAAWGRHSSALELEARFPSRP